MHSSLPFPPSFSYLAAEGGFLSAGDKGHPAAAAIGGSGMGEAEPLRVWRAPNWIPTDCADIQLTPEEEETTDDEGQIHPSFSSLFMATTGSSIPRTGFVKQCADLLWGHMGHFKWLDGLLTFDKKNDELTAWKHTAQDPVCLSDKIKWLMLKYVCFFFRGTLQQNFHIAFPRTTNHTIIWFLQAVKDPPPQK